jgi:hypothetical protein
MNEICFVFINKERSVTFITPDWKMFDRKFILYIFFSCIPNISITLLHKAFLQYNSITKHVINSCLNVIVSRNLGGHVRITDERCFMNELQFHFRGIRGRSYNELDKRSEAVCIWTKLKEGCGCQTDKVAPQFSGSTDSKKQTFSRSVARWRCKGSLHEDTV